MAVRAKLLPVAVACGMTGTLAAQESEAPDLGFLEFLGIWEEGDDEWFITDGLAEDGYAIETDEIDIVLIAAEEVADAAGADEAGDADGTDDTVESGESNDVEGPDEAETGNAD